MYDEMKAAVRSEPLVTQTLSGDTLLVRNWWRLAEDAQLSNPSWHKFQTIISCYRDNLGHRLTVRGYTVVLNPCIPIELE